MCNVRICGYGKSKSLLVKGFFFVFFEQLPSEASNHTCNRGGDLFISQPKYNPPNLWKYLQNMMDINWQMSPVTSMLTLSFFPVTFEYAWSSPSKLHLKGFQVH